MTSVVQQSLFHLQTVRLRLTYSPHSLNVGFSLPQMLRLPFAGRLNSASTSKLEVKFLLLGLGCFTLVGHGEIRLRTLKKGIPFSSRTVLTRVLSSRRRNRLLEWKLTLKTHCFGYYSQQNPSKPTGVSSRYVWGIENSYPEERACSTGSVTITLCPTNGLARAFDYGVVSHIICGRFPKALDRISYISCIL